MTEHQEDVERRGFLESHLPGLVDDIVAHYRPQRVILFGSLATGHVREWSDIDLVLVKDTDEKYYERTLELLRTCHWPWGLPVDFLIYNLAEFEFEKKNNPFFQQEILHGGKVLYDASA